MVSLITFVGYCRLNIIVVVVVVCIDFVVGIVFVVGVVFVVVNTDTNGLVVVAAAAVVVAAATVVVILVGDGDVTVHILLVEVVDSCCVNMVHNELFLTNLFILCKAQLCILPT